MCYPLLYVCRNKTSYCIFTNSTENNAFYRYLAFPGRSIGRVEEGADIGFEHQSSVPLLQLWNVYSGLMGTWPTQTRVELPLKRCPWAKALLGLMWGQRQSSKLVAWNGFRWMSQPEMRIRRVSGGKPPLGNPWMSLQWVQWATPWGHWDAVNLKRLAVFAGRLAKPEERGTWCHRLWLTRGPAVLSEAGWGSRGLQTNSRLCCSVRVPQPTRSLGCYLSPVHAGGLARPFPKAVCFSRLRSWRFRLLALK